MPTVAALGEAAAREAAEIIRATMERNRRARIIVATGNSQLALIGALVRRKDVDWKSVEVFHMDEYIGISPDHPSSFRYWIRTRVEEVVHPARVNYLDGDAGDIDGEMARYAGLLSAGPIDLAFVGFGENGHIAFNDPPVADFEDPAIVKRVALDEACRKQQAGEGHFFERRFGSAGGDDGDVSGALPRGSMGLFGTGGAEGRGRSQCLGRTDFNRVSGFAGAPPSASFGLSRHRIGRTARRVRFR